MKPRVPIESRPAAIPRLDTSAPISMHARIARIVASAESLSRAELVQMVGMPRTTVAQYVDELTAASILTEVEGASTSRGRPAARLRVNGNAGVVLVADLGAQHARLAVADLAQRTVAERACLSDVQRGPHASLDAMIAGFTELLAEPVVESRPVLGVVVGLPAPVDFERGVAVRPPVMPGWDGFPVGEYVSERLGAAVLVDNDVNLLALGEARTRPGSRAPLLFIKVSTGIGCGIVLSDGRLHRGADGAAGDIGHVRSRPAESLICRCGNVGCLEASASARAIATRLGVDDVETLRKLVLDSDATAIRLLRAAAREIGEVVALLVHILNPASVVLGGQLARMSDDVLAGVRSIVYRRALPLATRALAIENALHGERGGIVGGVVLGVEAALAPDRIARALRVLEPA